MLFHIVKASAPIAQMVFQNAPEKKKNQYREDLKNEDLRDYKMIIAVKAGTCEPHFYHYIPNKEAPNFIAEKIVEIARSDMPITVYGENDTLYYEAIRRAYKKTGISRLDLRRLDKKYLITTIDFSLQ